MKICQKCGAAYPEEALFCPGCGASLTSSSIPKNAAGMNAPTVAMPVAGLPTPPAQGGQAPQFAPLPIQSTPKELLQDAAEKPAEKKDKLGRVFIALALVIALVVGAGGGFTAAWFLYDQHKLAAAQNEAEYWIAEKVAQVCMDALNENDPGAMQDVLVSDAFLNAYYSGVLGNNKWKKAVRHYGSDAEAERAVHAYASNLNRTAFLYFAGGEVTTSLFGYEEKQYAFGEGHQDRLPLGHSSLRELRTAGAELIRQGLMHSFKYGDATFEVQDVRIFTVDPDGAVELTLVKLDGIWQVLRITAER